MTQFQLDYLENIIQDSINIYEMTRSSYELIEAIMGYYSMFVVDMRFKKAMFPGNKCLVITFIEKGIPEEYDIEIEY